MHASRLRTLGIVVFSLTTIGVILAVVFLLPQYLIPNDSSPAQTEALKAQNEVRATLLQGVAGLVLLIGAYFTWRQVQVSKEAQLTERFTRTIEHLGNSQVDVRIGGIYGLERLAKDSPTDRGPIAETIAAYVQGHSPWPAREGEAPRTGPGDRLSGLPSLRTRAPDIHAAMTVLGRRRGVDEEAGRLKLYNVDLRRANLRGADLRRADLRWSNLRGAYLPEAHLEAARLEYADLQGATLTGANLQKASLDGASLRGVVADKTTVWPTGFDPEAAGVFVDRQPN